MKEKIRVFAHNSNGKIEFTKLELEKLLQEVFDEGYNEGKKHYYSISYGSIGSPVYYGTSFTSAGTSNDCSDTIYTKADTTPLTGKITDSVISSC